MRNFSGEDEYLAFRHRTRVCLENDEIAASCDLHAWWETTKRGDRLIDLAAFMVGKPGWHTPEQIIIAACNCVEKALFFIPARENSIFKAIMTARACAYSQAGAAEVQVAGEAALNTHKLYANTFSKRTAHIGFLSYAAYCVNFFITDPIGTPLSSSVIYTSKTEAYTGLMDLNWNTANEPCIEKTDEYRESLSQCADIVRASLPAKWE